MFYSENGAENTGEERKAKANAQSAVLWECALNYRIMRQLEEGSEEEAWARLFSCSLFSSGKPRADGGRATAGA
ncbi:MAG: hypothetical protein ACI4RO_00045 [Candidatus Scatosoma sp.]